MGNDTIDMQKIKNQFAKGGIIKVKAANDALMEPSKAMGKIPVTSGKMLSPGQIRISREAFNKYGPAMLRALNNSPSATIFINEKNGEVTYDDKGKNQ